MEFGSDQLSTRDPLLLPEEQKGSSDLVVPDDMPVDLRVKLALSLINLGERIPEVHILCCSVNSISTICYHFFFDILETFGANIFNSRRVW